MTVFVSSAVHQERLVFGSSPPPGDGGLAGWRQLAGLYRASLAACGFGVEALIRPEIYQTPEALRAIGARPGDWHLAVKPIEHIRPFHGLANVFVCDWPYPELSTCSHGVSPFFDQVRLLGRADAVICCTDFTAAVLRGAGIEQVVTLPPVLPALALPPVLPALALPPGRPGDGALFVMEADLGAAGIGKIGPVIEGFVQAVGRRAGLRLVVRLRGGGALPASHDGVCYEDAAGPWPERPDFFLCGSAAEGLCLPLAQAMLAGVPAVTTMGAGLGSIAEGVALPIATVPGNVDAADDPLAAHLSLRCHPAAAGAVCEAVLEAAGLDEAARCAMAARGREVAGRLFSLEAFRAGLGRLAALVPAVRA